MIIFIPIKKNSQRVKNKNFRIFGEEPLYKHTLLKFPNDVVYVDTDNDDLIEEIKKDKRLNNVFPFKRKKELVGDEISVLSLIKNFIIEFDIKENVTQIHVTSPFLERDILIDAFKKMSEYDSVVSCNEYNSRFWRKEKFGYCPVNHNPLKLEQTQDLPKIYEENSAFYIFDPKNILNYNNRIGINPLFYPINFPNNIDIDTEKDWEIAISTLKEKKNEYY